MLAAVLAASALAACDSNGDKLTGSLAVPEAREARVTLTPALDVTGLVDSSLASRLVIEEITVNVSELRLLGANPQIPAAGYVLQDSAEVLSTLDGHAKYPFPSTWLDDDLAIYMHVDPSADLDGASVVVHARLYERPINAAHRSLRSTDDEDEAPNPDGEPANEEAPNPDGEPANEEAPNPDGEPANEEAPNPDGEPANEEAPNPDGEPANDCEEDGDMHDCIEAVGQTQQGLDTEPYQASRWVPFELRGKDVVDLVVGFDKASRLDVLLGIPAERWFTPAVIDRLEGALSDVVAEQEEPGAAIPAPKTVVVVREAPTSSLNDGERNETFRDEDGDYSLVDDDTVDPEDLRRH